MDELIKYQIEKTKFHQFIREYAGGEYADQRIGQAFYQYFELYKMNLPTEVDSYIYYTVTEISDLFTYFEFSE